MMKTLPALIIAFAAMLTACTPGDTADKLRNSQLPVGVPPVTFSYQYYTCGGPPEIWYNEAEKSVWAKYGVAPHNFGCMITDSILTAVKTHNDSLFTLLQSGFPGINEARIRQEIAASRQTLMKKP